jgi:hypothetical protein
MMTRPRVTEIAVALAPVEPDPFIAAPSRDPPHSGGSPRAKRARRSTELVRRVMRMRSARRARGG